MTSGPSEQGVLLVGVEPLVERAARPPPGEDGAQQGQVAPGKVGEQGWAHAGWQEGCGEIGESLREER